MKSDIISKTKFHLKKNITNEDRIKNETMESCDKIEKFKKYFLEENNKISINEYNNKTINYIKNNINNSLSNSHYYDEKTKNIIEENSTLFIEINKLKKEIDQYKDRLDELNNEYNKMKQDKRDNLIKSNTLDNIKIKKNFEDQFIKLEEEKYKIKLNHLLGINALLKENNQKALNHNEQMKKLYKLYTGVNWKNTI
jgi:hypothetical protein